jgi:hypothetical protein
MAVHREQNGHQFLRDPSVAQSKIGHPDVQCRTFGGNATRRWFMPDEDLNRRFEEWKRSLDRAVEKNLKRRRTPLF